MREESTDWYFLLTVNRENDLTVIIFSRNHKLNQSSFYRHIPKVLIKLNSIFKYGEIFQCIFLGFVLHFYFDWTLKSVACGVPWKSNQVRIAKYRVFILLKPFFCSGVAWVSTSKVPNKRFITINLRSFYLKTHCLMILSLVTLAQILDAPTTLWSLSALGWTVIFLTTEA